MTDIRSNTRAVEKNVPNAEFNKTTKKKLFKNKEHQRIYDAFLYVLKSNKIVQSGKKVVTFLSGNLDNILKEVDPKEVKSLSEENFCQFLLSVLKKIKAGNLASEENLKNGKIQELVNECITNARSMEGRDILVTCPGWLFGIKIDPKNVVKSFKKGILNKVPFLGNGEEEYEPPKSNTELVTDVLVKVFLPIFIFVVTAALLGVGPTMVICGVIGLMFATGKAIGSLFSNDKEDTLYNPLSTQTVQSKDWNEKIKNDVNNILNSTEKDLSAQQSSRKEPKSDRWADEIRDQDGSIKRQI